MTDRSIQVGDFVWVRLRVERVDPADQKQPIRVELDNPWPTCENLRRDGQVYAADEVRAWLRERANVLDREMTLRTTAKDYEVGAHLRSQRNELLGAACDFGKDGVK